MGPPRLRRACQDGPAQDEDLGPFADRGQKRSTKSRTNSVETEFMVASKEEISAQTSAAGAKPRTPLGSNSFIRVTKVAAGSRPETRPGQLLREGQK